MKELDCYKEQLKQLPEHIRLAEIEAEGTDTILAAYTNGELSGQAASDRTVIFVRAVGEKEGYVYTQNLNADPLEVLNEAYNNSIFGAEESKKLMNGSDEVSDKTDTVSIDHGSIAELKSWAKGLEQQIREFGCEITYASVEVSETIRTMGILNSKELCRSDVRKRVEVSIDVTREGDYHASMAAETSAASLEQIPKQYFLEKIDEWMKRRLPTVSIEAGTCEAVLDASVVCNIFLTAWQMFSGYQYCRHATALDGKLGEQIFFSGLNVTDCPNSSYSGYGRAFDCEGTDSGTVKLVENGRFCGLMHNLASADEMHTVSTGNAGRDISLMQDQTEVKVIPSNFTICPGDTKKSEMLSELQDGIYISDSFDQFHSFNVGSGDFAIPCVGVRYENGKAVGEVKGITINGNLPELLNRITQISDDICTTSMVMSKSFCIAAPTIKVRAIDIGV